MGNDRIERIDNKSNDFADYKFKALAVGGSFYLNRKFGRILQKNKIQMSYRNEILIKSFKKSIKLSKMRGLNEIVVSNSVGALVSFCELDNAYNQVLHNALKFNYEQLKKDGLLL